MGIISRLFGKPKQNALVVLENSNSELRKLLFLEKQHSAELLKQLSKALQNRGGNPYQTNAETAKEARQATPREKDILALFQTKDTISSQDVCKALGYSCRQIASKHLSNMLRKGLIAKTGTGKNTKYKLPE